MKKDLNWFKEQLDDIEMNTPRLWSHDSVWMLDRVNELLNQLDEPETLSQELPVIPKFVAEWIEERNGQLENWKLPSTFRSDVKYKADQRQYEWANKKGNMDIFMEALLLGYEVEKDQKYVLSINITDKASKTNYETFLNKRGIFHSMDNESFNSEEFNWAEEEIKDLENGEILFEHFAVKVEELEE